MSADSFCEDAILWSICRTRFLWIKAFRNEAKRLFNYHNSGFKLVTPLSVILEFCNCCLYIFDWSVILSHLHFHFNFLFHIVLKCLLHVEMCERKFTKLLVYFPKGKHLMTRLVWYRKVLSCFMSWTTCFSKQIAKNNNHHWNDIIMIIKIEV